MPLSEHEGWALHFAINNFARLAIPCQDVIKRDGVTFNHAPQSAVHAGLHSTT